MGASGYLWRPGAEAGPGGSTRASGPDAPPRSLRADARLEPRDDCDVQPARLLAADSWLVDEGRVRALELHRRRFADAVVAVGLEPEARDLDGFWEAAIATLPRTGAWFPRVEARLQRDAPQLLLRVREAPERAETIVLATHPGPDPRTAPRTKGPDLEAMLRLRTQAQGRGAGEAVILEPDGAIAEGSTTCLLWWRGDDLALPPEEVARVDSVTVRSVLALASARGVAVRRERAAPEDLEGCEVWALNALHGARIVTAWVDGPATAAEPGRLATWRAALDALRKPLPDPAPATDSDPSAPATAPSAGES
ncbi:MAG: aminotransferase class IV [Actinomycetales bacterium]|nr:aminotransferase class IV [Actinomycetales bacterium]